MKKLILLFFVITLCNCVGEDIYDDFVEQRIIVSNPISDLKVGDTYQFGFSYFNNVGKKEDVNVNWMSSNTSVITIDNQGLATAVAEGTTKITVSLTQDENIKYELSVNSGSETVMMEDPTEIVGVIKSTSSYQLEGDFTLADAGHGLELRLASNFKATTALPGLYVYLSNNPTSISNAYEIGAVTVFSGANTMSIDASIGIMDYTYLLYFCKPYNVKVGHGKISN
ncbi:Ig-like domain-containing protein [Reichenbachiella sp. MALMAid0571]|uniref:Ig-like domain-containing protein n=1 Tax=Reichenbachiella sp. MALMAid0571 TaxID=3143939 RepID=UPI0032DECAEF